MKKISSVQEKFCLRLLAGCAAAALLMAPGRASAQTIDYGALEALFGEPVTTSATGSPQRAPDVPVTMEIVTADQIRRSGATNIPDALRNVTGVAVDHWGSSQEEVSIRGYNQVQSDRLLVLVNGRQVYQDDLASVNWGNVPIQLSEIRQIEVVKGPNTALFGFNAVGGVINIITYNPMYDKVNQVGASYGLHGYGEGHAIGTGKIGNRAGVRLSAGIQREREFNGKAITNPFGFSPNGYPHQYEASLDGVVQITDKSQIRIEASTSESHLSEEIYFYIPYDLDDITRSARISYLADTRIGQIETGVYTNWLDLRSPFQNSQTYREHITEGKIQDLFQIGNDHHFRVALEMRNNGLGGALNQAIGGTAVNYDVYSASGMWEWKMRSNLTWTNAVREDMLYLWRTGVLIPNPRFSSNAQWEQTMPALSYNSGLVWEATPEDTFRLTTARGIQTPSMLGYSNIIPLGGGLFILGNPDLKPVVVTNYEIGVDHKIESINGKGRASVFYQTSVDLSSAQGLFNGVDTFLAANVGKSRTEGFELGLDGKFGEGWSWNANYLFQEVQDTLLYPVSGFGIIPYSPENATPVHTINAHIGYTSGPWEYDAFAHLISGHKVESGEAAAVSYALVSVPTYLDFDGRVAYKVNDHVTVALSGRQLQAAHKVETSGRAADRQVFLSVSAGF